MSYRDLIKQISNSMYQVLSDKFMDALLESKEGSNIPSYLAKAMLYHSVRDRLASEDGLVNLLEALAVADPESAVAILEEFGLEDIELASTPAEV